MEKPDHYPIAFMFVKVRGSDNLVCASVLPFARAQVAQALIDVLLGGGIPEHLRHYGHVSTPRGVFRIPRRSARTGREIQPTTRCRRVRAVRLCPAVLRRKQLLGSPRRGHLCFHSVKGKAMWAFVH